jgi:hypothetical protein
MPADDAMPLNEVPTTKKMLLLPILSDQRAKGPWAERKPVENINLQRRASSALLPLRGELAPYLTEMARLQQLRYIPESRDL